MLKRNNFKSLRKKLPTKISFALKITNILLFLTPERGIRLH